MPLFHREPSVSSFLSCSPPQLLSPSLSAEPLHPPHPKASLGLIFAVWAGNVSPHSPHFPGCLWLLFPSRGSSSTKPFLWEYSRAGFGTLGSTSSSDGTLIIFLCIALPKLPAEHLQCPGSPGKAEQGISGQPGCASAPVCASVPPEQGKLCPAGPCCSDTGFNLGLHPFRSWALMILGLPQLRGCCELLLVQLQRCWGALHPSPAGNRKTPTGGPLGLGLDPVYPLCLWMMGSQLRRSLDQLRGSSG